MTLLGYTDKACWGTSHVLHTMAQTGEPSVGCVSERKPERRTFASFANFLGSTRMAVRPVGELLLDARFSMVLRCIRTYLRNPLTLPCRIIIHDGRRLRGRDSIVSVQCPCSIFSWTESLNVILVLTCWKTKKETWKSTIGVPFEMHPNGHRGRGPTVQCMQCALCKASTF